MNSFANDETYTVANESKLELFAAYFSEHHKDVCIVNTELHDLAKTSLCLNIRRMSDIT